MSIRANDLIVIDTNALVHWVRQDPTGKSLLEQYALGQRVERPVLPTVVEGEILGLARCWKWGKDKLKRLCDILTELVRIDVGHPDIVHAYADLYFSDQKEAHNTGENDLWIAATAKATGAVLLTCDADFRWMSPTHLQVEIAAQSK
jgi:tRNA(fMet)-specific endonuclease VapC